MATIDLNNVGKRYGGVVAVSDVNLYVHDGEFIVLVGPSGCGKSTTLRMIAGLEPITDGTIRLGGSVINDLAPKDRDIAMVFQSYALYPHMTVASNMGFGLKMKKVAGAEIDRRVRSVAGTLNIQDLLDRKPRELSGGQRQRVAMGRALVRDPKAFLFDEPLSNLDANLRAQMRVEIKRLHKRLGATIVYVTHDQIEAMTLADRIVLMNKGQVVQIDDPMTMYERPRSKFAAGFLGTPRMNFIPVRVVESKAGGLAVRLSPEIELALPEHLGAAYRRYAGHSMEIGLRAEHLIVGGEAKPGTASFEAPIDLVEPTGSEALAFLTIDGTEVAARAMPQDIRLTGTRVKLAADMNRIHLIEPSSGMVVPSPSWSRPN